MEVCNIDPTARSPTAVTTHTSERRASENFIQAENAVSSNSSSSTSSSSTILDHHHHHLETKAEHSLCDSRGWRGRVEYGKGLPVQ